MLTRIAIAGAAVAAGLIFAAPAANAQIGMMTAHNYEILMRGVQRHHAVTPRTAYHRALARLARQGYRGCISLPSTRGVYRFQCYRNGRGYLATASARNGEILAIRRG